MTNELTHIFDQIYDAIDHSQRILLSMHRGPDGDTAGSALALSHYLTQIGKEHVVCCIDPLPESLRFLPGASTVVQTSTLTDPLHTLTFDLVIVLDSSDSTFNGVSTYLDTLTTKPTIINIDHHATNTQYGDIQLVIDTASSTCEIVYSLLAHRAVLTKDMATCLLTGLMTDTGGLTNLATTASAVHTASALLLRGAQMKQIIRNTMLNRNVPTLKLWGRALDRLHITPQGIAVTAVTLKDIQECDADAEAVEGVSNFLNSLDDRTDAQGVLVLSERTPQLVKGSLRTTHPLMDVSKLATLLGGGGHKKAAGFSIPGRLVLTNSQWHIEPEPNQPDSWKRINTLQQALYSPQYGQKNSPTTTSSRPS